jgi:hypothetical protein
MFRGKFLKECLVRPARFTHPWPHRRHLPHAFDTRAIYRTAKGGKKGRMETGTKEISVCRDARPTGRTWEDLFRRSKHLISNCIQPIPLYSGSKNKNKNRGTDILSALRSTAAKDGSVSIFLVSASRNSQIRVHLCPSVVQSSVKTKIYQTNPFRISNRPCQSIAYDNFASHRQKNEPIFSRRPPTSDLPLHASRAQSCPVEAKKSILQKQRRTCSLSKNVGL